MLFSNEYQLFVQLLKLYVELSLLLKLIPYDIAKMNNAQCKLHRSYIKLLSEIHPFIERDIPKLKRKMYQLGGQMVEEKQEKSYRLVIAKFKGYIYEHRFANDVLRNDCESIVYAYLKGHYVESLLQESNG